MIELLADGQRCMALVDSGCSKTLMSKSVCRLWRSREATVVTADRKTLTSLDVEPVVGSQPSSEDSTQLVYLKSSPLSVASNNSTLPTDADMASSSKDEDLVIPLRRSAWQKRPAPWYAIMTGGGGGSR